MVFIKRSPWEQLFNIACLGKSSGTCDLIPYWVFEEGSARVERRIPLLPYCKEIGKLKRLKKCLGLYRMAFGQPRQEDQFLSLAQHEDLCQEEITDLMISLEPPETV